MPTQEDPREDSEPLTTPVSRVDNRVIACGSALSAKAEPRLALSRRILTAFVIETKANPPTLRTHVGVPGVDDLLVTDICNIRLFDDNGANEIAHTMSFEYRGRSPLQFVTESKDLYAQIRKSLFKYGLRFKSGTGPTVHKLSIEPRVPASVRISADIIGAVIKVTLHNVLALGTADYLVPAERFDRAIVEALVDLVVNRSETYYQLAAEFASPR